MLNLYILVCKKGACLCKCMPNDMNIQQFHLMQARMQCHGALIHRNRPWIWNTVVGKKKEISSSSCKMAAYMLLPWQSQRSWNQQFHLQELLTFSVIYCWKKMWEIIFITQVGWRDDVEAKMMFFFPFTYPKDVPLFEGICQIIASPMCVSERYTTLHIYVRIPISEER